MESWSRASGQIIGDRLGVEEVEVILYQDFSLGEEKQDSRKPKSSKSKF